MPKMGGLEATRGLMSHGSQTRVLVLTTFDADEYVYEAWRGAPARCSARAARMWDVQG